MNHLKGSSFLGQLADNVIAMGRVNNDNEKEVYIKQITVRNSAEVYGASNVIHTRTIMKDKLIHEAIGLCYEQELLSVIIGDSSKSQNRLFFVFAVLYYGLNEASRVLKELEISGSSSGNLSHHVTAF